MDGGSRMKRPVSFKIDIELHDAALDLLASSKVKYRSFTNIVEQALLRYLEQEQKPKAMKALRNLIGYQTYQVVDNPDNRFNFFGLVGVESTLIEVAAAAEYYTEWNLAGPLPEDVKKAVNVMAENGADVTSFTGVITFADNEGVEDTYYLLTW